MCCSVWQCLAVCCSVLRCVAVCRNVLQCVAVCCTVLYCVAACCSVFTNSISKSTSYSTLYNFHISLLSWHLFSISITSSSYVSRFALQCVAYCSVSRCVAVRCGVLRCVAVCYGVLRCVVVCCSVLQCVAVCCSVHDFSIKLLIK